jgi:putative hemolysin
MTHVNALLLLLSLTTLACSGQTSPSQSPSSGPTPAPDGGSSLANPASKHCVDHGGTLEIRSGDGGQYGVCRFTGGSECEEWAYYRGECQPK